MYCSQCGKKVKDNMLFCPFCGSPIVIPEQDDDDRQAPAAPVQRPESKPASVAQKENAFAEVLEELSEEGKNEFVPLDLDIKWEEPHAQPKAETEDISREVSDVLNRQLQEEPVRLQGRTPDLSASATRGAPKISSRNTADTHVPPIQFDPNNMFLDEEDEDDYDDFEDDDFEYEYEEPEHGSFFMRHIRGLVTLILFAVVALVILGWALSAPGQQALARAGLAWKPTVYAEVAYEAYQNGSYALAGSYYAQALERDGESYDYANSAGVSYYMANDSLNAEAMARLAIKINPSRAEAYELLLRLYPDASTRTMEIQGLIQTGYQLTGKESLNIQ